jgi:ATP-dependent DNA ligase
VDLPDETVIDGEIVALDVASRPDFNLLQNFREAASQIVYYAFDLLVCSFPSKKPILADVSVSYGRPI